MGVASSADLRDALEVLQRVPEDGQSSLFLLVMAGEPLSEHSKRSLAGFVWMSVSLASSAGNLQSYEIYAVNNAEKKLALSHASGDQEFISQASVCLVFFAIPGIAASRYGKRGKEV